MSTNESAPVEQLLPCPCCQSTNIIPPPKHWPDGCVYCRNCGLRANSPTAWNTRIACTPTAVDGDMVERNLAGHFKWAAPGDRQEDVWLIRFDDNDIHDLVFIGDDAEKEAWQAWNRHSPGYNCRVFRLAELSSPSIRAKALEDAAKVADRNAKWHAESFRKELTLKNEERQTHFAARCREAEEIAAAIRSLLVGA